MMDFENSFFDGEEDEDLQFFLPDFIVDDLLISDPKTRVQTKKPSESKLIPPYTEPNSKNPQSYNFFDQEDKYVSEAPLRVPDFLQDTSSTYGFQSELLYNHVPPRSYSSSFDFHQRQRSKSPLQTYNENIDIRLNKSRPISKSIGFSQGASHPPVNNPLANKRRSEKRSPFDRLSRKKGLRKDITTVKILKRGESMDSEIERAPVKQNLSFATPKKLEKKKTKSKKSDARKKPVSIRVSNVLETIKKSKRANKQIEEKEQGLIEEVKRTKAADKKPKKHNLHARAIVPPVIHKRDRLPEKRKSFLDTSNGKQPTLAQDSKALQQEECNLRRQENRKGKKDIPKNTTGFSSKKSIDAMHTKADSNHGTSSFSSRLFAFLLFELSNIAVMVSNIFLTTAGMVKSKCRMLPLRVKREAWNLFLSIYAVSSSSLRVYGRQYLKIIFKSQMFHTYGLIYVIPRFVSGFGLYLIPHSVQINISLLPMILYYTLLYYYNCIDGVTPDPTLIFDYEFFRRQRCINKKQNFVRYRSRLLIFAFLCLLTFEVLSESWYLVHFSDSLRLIVAFTVTFLRTSEHVHIAFVISLCMQILLLLMFYDKGNTPWIKFTLFNLQMHLL